MMISKLKTSYAKDYFLKGYQLQAKGEIEPAIKSYKKSIDYFPTAEAHTFLGEAYGMQGKFKDAINECLTAICLDDRYGNAYNDIGSYLICLGDYEEAIFWLKEAIYNTRYHHRYFSFYNIGGIYEIKGDWERALKYYRKAVNDNPDYDPARKALISVLVMMN